MGCDIRRCSFGQEPRAFYSDFQDDMQPESMLSVPVHFKLFWLYALKKNFEFSQIELEEKEMSYLTENKKHLFPNS